MASYLDLHCHSVSSDDSRATAEQYARWVGVLRRRGYRIDGLVLTEHRKFDFDKDYADLGKEHEVLMLKGSELDTDSGHFLVYGVTEELIQQIDFSRVDMNATELIDAARDCGALAVPAHPGRAGIGLYEFISAGAQFNSIGIVEHLNGSNRPGEQERAEELLEKFGYQGIGGSDAHVVSALGSCMTWFEKDIASEPDLVSELLSGDFTPVWLEDTAGK